MSQPAFIEFDISRDLRQIDGGTNQDNVDAEAKETVSRSSEAKVESQSSKMESLSKEPEFRSQFSPGPVITCTTLPQQPSSISYEKSKDLKQEGKQELVEKLPALKFDIESGTYELQKVNAVSEPSRPLTSCSQRQLSYPEQLEVPLNQQVEVVYVNNPSSFYLQLLESCIVIGELGAKLNTVYSGKFRSINRLQLN